MAIMICFVGVSFGQEVKDSTQIKDSIENKIIYSFDVMTDVEYLKFEKGLLCSRDGETGFIIFVDITLEKGIIKYDGFRVTSANIGSCLEESKIIFLFEDDTKIDLVSWNDFNCKGNSYYDLYAKFWDKISTKKVTAIRFTNGRSYESYTYELTSKEQSYFMELNELIKENKYTEK